MPQVSLCSTADGRGHSEVDSSLFELENIVRQGRAVDMNLWPIFPGRKGKPYYLPASEYSEDDYLTASGKSV